MQSLVVVPVRLPCTHLFWHTMDEDVFSRHIVIISCISLVVRFYHAWTLPMDFVWLFWFYMDFLYDGCRIFDLYMMCYGCFMFHDIHVDFWPMMNTDTFVCRWVYDMMYMYWFDIWLFWMWCIYMIFYFFSYANIMNENVLYFMKFILCF